MQYIMYPSTAASKQVVEHERRPRRNEGRLWVRVDIIGHARINVYVNISHAWFKMADYIRTHRTQCSLRARAMLL